MKYQAYIGIITTMSGRGMGKNKSHPCLICRVNKHFIPSHCTICRGHWCLAVSERYIWNSVLVKAGVCWFPFTSWRTHSKSRVVVGGAFKINCPILLAVGSIL